MTTPAYADYAAPGGHPHAITFTAGAAIEAGQIVQVDTAAGGDTVIPGTGIANPYAGVAAQAVIAGQEVTVLCGSGVIHETDVAGTVTPGQFVAPGATGQVTSTGATQANAIGVAVRGGQGAAPASPCRWLAYK